MNTPRLTRGIFCADAGSGDLWYLADVAGRDNAVFDYDKVIADIGKPAAEFIVTYAPVDRGKTDFSDTGKFLQYFITVTAFLYAGNFRYRRTDIYGFNSSVGIKSVEVDGKKVGVVDEAFQVQTVPRPFYRLGKTSDTAASAGKTAFHPTYDALMRVSAGASVIICQVCLRVAGKRQNAVRQCGISFGNIMVKFHFCLSQFLNFGKKSCKRGEHAAFFRGFMVSSNGRKNKRIFPFQGKTSKGGDVFFDGAAPIRSYDLI